MALVNFTGGGNSGAFGNPIGANYNQPNNQQSSFNSGLMNIGTGVNAGPFGAPYNANDPFAQSAYASSMGNLAGAQYATAANRVNQNTPYGSLNYSQSVDQYGNPTWTANQTLDPALQSLVSGSMNQLQQGLQTPVYGINPGETYTDAIMRRLQPQMAQSQESFDVKMANQGIPVGSEAYKRAATQFQQGQNDLLTSAQVQGMQTGLQAGQLQNQTATAIKGLSTPSYVNPYSQAAVAGPDYLGAAGLSNQNALGIQNAANAASQNLQSGLFNLGSSLITNPGVQKMAGKAFDYFTA
jgi:hypothetical protein